MIVYASIGNSDNKLTQAQWANFCEEFRRVMVTPPITLHGVWFSLPNVPWQNMCIGIEVESNRVANLKEALKSLAYLFNQDSIAWLSGAGELLTPPICMRPVY